MATLYPSLISANFLHLGAVMDQVGPHCDGFHLDIMDNHFVPNLTWGAASINSVAAYALKPVWVHLMVDNPAQWPAILTLPPESLVSFHIEATQQVESLIKEIREKKWRPSIALSPQTPISTVFEWAHLVDQILIMSVNPGFSGQKFIPQSREKIRALAAHRIERNLGFSIGIDGGITKELVAELAELGVNEFAVASAIFSAPDIIEATQTLRRLAS